MGGGALPGSPFAQHHHPQGGVELRVTVAVPAEERDHEAPALDELESMLRLASAPGVELSRLPGLGAPPDAPKRVFSARLAGHGSGLDLIRSLQAWMMRHSGVTVTLRADGPRGGTSLQVRRFSAVAFAEVAAKIGPYLLGGTEGSDKSDPGE